MFVECLSIFADWKVVSKCAMVRKSLLLCLLIAKLKLSLMLIGLIHLFLFFPSFVAFYVK